MEVDGAALVVLDVRMVVEMVVVLMTIGNGQSGLLPDWTDEWE